MSTLRVLGDYRFVLASGVSPARLQSVVPRSGQWGIGLGAPPEKGEPTGFLGEAILCGCKTVFLPTGQNAAAVMSPNPFPSGFFVHWGFDDAICYDFAPGDEWRFDVTMKQILGEVGKKASSSGIYAFVIGGIAASFDVQALITSPVEANRPQDGAPINSATNYPRYLRRNSGAYAMHPFVAAGLFLNPSAISVSGPADLLANAFGELPRHLDFAYHAHAAILSRKITLDWHGCDSPSAIEECVGRSEGYIMSVEHILPGTLVREAKLFITPITAFQAGA
ncbi:MAG: hypothetical protein WC712_04285 [Candidatus Brocadiia bacterium]